MRTDGHETGIAGFSILRERASTMAKHYFLQAYVLFMLSFRAS